MIINLVFLAVAVAVLALIEITPIRRSITWRAMTAPLASIIGSGFLVSAPLLAREFGGLAIFAMAALCAFAWAVGGVVRYNIGHAEPLIARDGLARGVAATERMSHVALVFAYIVSTAYYLSLLGAFVTKQFSGAPDPIVAKLIATGLLALIGWLGWSGGLRKVIAVESHVVAVKLAIIGGFIAALAFHGATMALSGASVAPPPPRGGWDSAPVLLGLLIVVQGFETSRFLGEEFDASTRIRTMRLAQIVATAIYLAFFALMSPMLATALHGAGETAIIDVAAALSLLLPLALTVGAVASQFSAAVADSIGGAGLASGASRRVDSAHAYPVLAFVSALALWETDIYGVIALASRAFAVYYMLQCAVAAAITLRFHGWTPATLWRATLGAACAAAAVFGVPAA